MVLRQEEIPESWSMSTCNWNAAMTYKENLFIGIDPSGGRQPFVFAVLDEEARVVSLAEGEMEAILAVLNEQEAVTVAICAAPRPNLGLVREQMVKLGQNPGYLRGADMRVAEYELRQRGILISTTPGRDVMCPAWIQLGFTLYRKLDEMGYKPYPAGEASPQFFETHPHAVFCALLEQNPLPKPTLEGRLQRQLVLYERGLGIKDPMDFFEEITRFRLLQGVLPMDLIYPSEQLDALSAAFTAYIAGTRPGDVSFTGSAREGQIALPVRELKDQY